MQIIKHITKWVLLIFLSFGCGSNRFDIDLNGKKADLKLSRLDLAFLNADIHQLEAFNKEMLKAHGRFYKVYLQQVLRIGIAEDPAVSYSIKSFLEDTYVRDLLKEVSKTYPSIDLQKEQLDQAFSYYKYHFPDRIVPEIITAVSGFSANVMVTDSVLGIGLDLYLGANHRFYKETGIPVFKSAQMTSENMPYDAMRGWLSSEFENVEKKKDLITQMVRYGKVLYLMDAMFPNTQDHWKIGYTADQVKWCEENDFLIWTTIIDKEMLYSTNVNEIRRFVGEAPFTAGLPKQSPGKIGFWVGWQIVRDYMDQFPETSLEELMALKDAQQILQKSKYKPSN